MQATLAASCGDECQRVHVRIVMAFQAKVLSRFRQDVPVRIVAGRAVEFLGVVVHVVGRSARDIAMTLRALEVEGNSDLMRMDDLLHPPCILVTGIAVIRLDSVQIV